MPRRPGFTLIELMVTLTIIAVAVSLAIPVVQQSIRDRHLQQSAMYFMNAFRDARSRATFRYAAHIVRVNLTTTPPTEQIVEGDSDSCTLANFPATNLVFTNTDLQTNTDVAIANSSPGGATYIEFCYSPSGTLFYRFDTSSMFTNDNGAGIGRPLNGGFVYQFSNNVYPNITHRRVVIPLGGQPRFAQ